MGAFCLTPRLTKTTLLRRRTPNQDQSVSLHPALKWVYSLLIRSRLFMPHRTSLPNGKAPVWIGVRFKERETGCSQFSNPYSQERGHVFSIRLSVPCVGWGLNTNLTLRYLVMKVSLCAILCIRLPFCIHWCVMIWVEQISSFILGHNSPLFVMAKKS